MTVTEALEYCNRLGDEFLKVGRVRQPEHERVDLAGLILIAKLVPGSGDIIGGTAHDLFYVSVDLEAFCAVATEAHLLELVRYGVSC